MTITQIFMATIVLIVFIMDVYLIKKHGKQKSFSAYIIRYVKYNKLAFFTTLGAGIVIGHVFWSMDTVDIYENVDCKKIELIKNE